MYDHLLIRPVEFEEESPYQMSTSRMSLPERLGAEDRPPEPELKRGVLGLPAVVMQSVTHIAPALAVLFSLQLAVQQAGVTAPLTYLAAFLVVLVLAVVLVA